MPYRYRLWTYGTDIECAGLMPTKFVRTGTCSHVAMVISDAATDFITYPFDLLATRMQVQGRYHMVDGNLEKFAHYGSFKATKNIIQTEGFHMLWHGFSTNIWLNGVITVTTLITYIGFQKNFCASGDVSIQQEAFCGFWGNVLATMIANPAEIIKVQVQVEGRKIFQGEIPRFNSHKQALLQIMKNNGYRGFWRGSIANGLCAGSQNVSDYLIYDRARSGILMHTNITNDSLIGILSSFLSSTVATVMGLPAEVIKTRVMVHSLDLGGTVVQYKNCWRCFQHIIRYEGFVALFSGIVPYWVRTAPWQFVICSFL